MSRARAVPAAVLLTSGLLGGCGAGPTRDAAEPPLWRELTALCGQAFEGRVVEGTEPSDDAMRAERLVMHVRSCEDNELRVPFHVGENRSRTWVITRTDAGLRLKHDHRHEDGTLDATTEYGGDSSATTGTSVAFPADAYTAQLLPAAATNVWTLTIEPGRTFTYALHRENSPRRFRAEFDLTKQVEPPPAPW